MNKNEIRIIKFFDKELNEEVTFELRNLSEEADFWDSFGYKDKVYDVHYCEDYNSIDVYRVVDKIVDITNTIHSEKIKK
ncbi:MAG: hypothetical protein KC414_03430 [Romboutsia sp.]|nr:hypothetical protein [Romboutsia sp.]